MKNLIDRFFKRAENYPEVVLTSSDLESCNFFQFKRNTAKFFFDRFKKTQIANTETPHYAFADALCRGDNGDIENAKCYYREYLDASWGVKPEQKFKRRIQDFEKTFHFYRKHGINENIVVTYLPTSEKPYIVDGNHRCAFGATLDLPVTANVMPMEDIFKKYIQIKGRYGTKQKDMPYQSIFLSGEHVVEGRRTDLKQRMAMIPTECINGRRILDIACNLGMSSILAKAMGASTSVGVEVSSKMVDLANRFAMFEGFYPDTRFYVMDVNVADFEGEVFDTAFIFSIYRHLDAPERLAEIVKNHVKESVIFETHPKDRIDDYPSFFGSGLFQSVEEIGRLHTSQFTHDNSRILLHCRR